MIFYILYKIGEFIALIFPLKMAYMVGIFFSDLHYLFAWKDHANVAANLKAIFPEKSIQEIKAMRLRMSRNFAKYLIDFFRFSRLDKNNIKKFLHTKNLHYIDNALKNGKGAIILTAHIGNWEVGGVGMALLGYDIGVVALSHRHGSVDKFFIAQREQKGVSVLPLGRAARDCLKFLRENKIIALVGDRNFGSKGTLIDLFGLPTYLPEGPAVFSLKIGTPIIPAFVLRNPDDTHTLTFEKPIEFTPTGDKDNDLLELMEKYKLVIEHYIKTYPEHWFMFRKFWAEQEK